MSSYGFKRIKDTFRIVIDKIQSTFLDRRDQMGLYQIAMLDHCCARVFERNLAVPKVDNERFRLFVVSQTVRIDPSLYDDIRTLKEQIWNMEHGYTGIGKSSLHSCGIYTVSDRPLIHYYKSFALVDLQTRRPTAISTQTREVFLQRMFTEDLPRIPLKFTHKMETPSHCFRSSHKVCFSHTDFNDHANLSEYFRFLSDTIIEASVANFFRYFGTDIWQYPITSVHLNHLGETNTGDMLEVCLWQDEQDDSKVLCNMYCSTREVVSCAVEFGKSKFMVQKPRL